MKIICIGRNYEEHAREMKATVSLDAPVFFCKPADAIVTDGADVPYPSITTDLHHEVELVVALQSGGRDLDAVAAHATIYGYAVGLDLTRRDIQAKAKEKGHPWDMGKGFDQSAVAGAIKPVAASGYPAGGRIWLKVNGELRQDGDLADMMWKVVDIIANLSTMVRLEAGDLIYTGTPAGVGPVRPGDVLEGGVDGVGSLRARIV